MATKQSGPAPDGKPNLGVIAQLREAGQELDSYWFGFGSATTLGVLRIFTGLLCLADLLMLLVDFPAWFSEWGFVPLRLQDQHAGPLDRVFIIFSHQFTLPFTVPRLNVLSEVTDSRITLAVFLITTLAALTTAFGLWSRLSSIVLAIGMVSIQHRNMLLLHGGDSVIRLAALYVALSPSGRTLSFDRLRRLWKGEESGPPKPVSLWPQRLFQYNLALIYFTAWWLKMDGSRWRNGTATWFPARLDEFVRFPVPGFVNSRFFVPVFTYGTLLTELSLATLVFYKPARRYVLIAGILMHGYIEYSMNIPLFAVAIVSWYIAFYSGEEVAQFVEGLGNRLKRFRVTVNLPLGATLRPGAASVLAAVDPLHLVQYQSGSDSDWNVTDSKEVTTRGGGRALLRSIGAYPLALGWGRLLNASLETGRTDRRQ